MLNKLLNSLGEDAQIDDELYNRIYQSMLQRLKDKCPMVRIQAVTALARLQDPEDAECPVITGLVLCHINIQLTFVERDPPPKKNKDREYAKK